MMLREEEIQQEIFADTKIFHFGTLSILSGTDLCNDEKRWKQGILKRKKCICGTVFAEKYD